VYLSSCLNPLIYGFMSKNFRQSFDSELQELCLAITCNVVKGRRQDSQRGHGAASTAVNGREMSALARRDTATRCASSLRPHSAKKRTLQTTLVGSRVRSSSALMT